MVLLHNHARLFTALLLVLTIGGCTPNTNRSTPQNSTADFGNATWIGVQEDLPETDSLLYDEYPSPIFRKEFAGKPNIRTATLFITSAGYYLATINGSRIGKNYLDPAWTNFEKRVYYSEYDLTTAIKKGSNCLGVTLGNGFYNPLPLKMWGNLNLRDALPSGKPVFIARLKLEYENGEVDEIVTDDSWKYAHGPIIKNNVYLGERYNANKEINGWQAQGFDDGAWNEVKAMDGPGGKLQKAFLPPIQISNEITPHAITMRTHKKFIVDMGVNFTGLYNIHLRGRQGDTVTFRFGERLYQDGSLNPMTTVAGQIKTKGKGGPGAPAVAWQTDSYIFGADTAVWYRPEFTFHTYRYMEISGLDVAPTAKDIQGIALSANVKNSNSFSCSSELINAIQVATRQTFQSNLMSVQSDCAAREKFGYGGDLNATSEAFIYNYEMQDFYRKTIYDWVDAMNDTVFVDTAPYVGLKYCGISWESAFLITQYKLFQYYNDTTIIKELYEMDLKWMEKVARIHPEGIVQEGLSDHEALEPVPVELTGTTHYLECARIMKTFASFMNDNEHEIHFKQLENKLTAIVLDKYWKTLATDSINKQTLYATLLYYDIVPKEEVKTAVELLQRALANGPNSHFNTGIFGTKFILEALSKNGQSDMVFNIINSTTYPGWGHMIDRGATTLWETWKESDNVYSNCHPMFGSVSEWFYRWLGGIRPLQAYPGFEKFIINPAMPKGLTSASSTYHSPYGKIISNWKVSPNETVFEIEIPEGSAALFKVPIEENQKITVNESNSGRSIIPVRAEELDGAYELPGGRYTVLVF